MNLKTNLTFSFIIGFILLLYNVSRIPAGDEMGAIIEMFIAGLYAIIIYALSSFISIIAWKTISRNKNAIQISLLLLCVSLIYYSTWKVCVYRTPPLTVEEQKKIEIERTKKAYAFFNQIPKLIREGYTYKPSNDIFEKDSLLILNSLKTITGKEFTKIDSVSRVKIGKFLNYSSYYLFEDKLKHEVALNLQTISHTLKVRNIFYSPNNNVFLTFISYKTKYTNNNNKLIDGGEAITLIGYKQDTKMIFYEYCKDDSSFNSIVNLDDLAYSLCFQKAIGLSDFYYYKDYKSFLNESFWKNESVLRNTKINNKMFYGFEAFIRVNDNKYELIAPVLELNIKTKL